MSNDDARHAVVKDNGSLGEYACVTKDENNYE